MIITVGPVYHAVFQGGKIVPGRPKDSEECNHNEGNDLEHAATMEPTRFIRAW